MCCGNFSICTVLQDRLDMNLSAYASARQLQSYSMAALVTCIEGYAVPLIVLTGIATSTFTSVVLLRTSLRKRFFSHFLAGVSLSSLGFLLTLMLNWMFQLGYPVFDVAGVCQMSVFCSHFFPFLSFWLAVVGSLLILFDLGRQKSVPWMTSPTVAKIWVIGLALLSFTLYSYKTWTYSSSRSGHRDICIVIGENEEAMEILGIVDLFLLLCLPSLTYVIFDLTILVRLCAVNGHSPFYKRRHREVLKIVLCYCVFFQLLVLPRAVATSLLTFNRWVYNKKPSVTELAVNQVLQILFYLYFAINPIFPFCVSNKFRRNLKDLLYHRCSRDITIRPLRPVSPTL